MTIVPRRALLTNRTNLTNLTNAAYNWSVKRSLAGSSSVKPSVISASEAKKAVAARLYDDVLRLPLRDARSLESFVGKIVDAPSEPFVTAYVPSENPANVTVSFLRTDGFDLVGTASEGSGIVLIEPRRARSRKRPMQSTSGQ